MSFGSRQPSRAGSALPTAHRDAPTVPRRYARSERVVRGVRRHWLATVLVLLGLYNGVPWLAPVFLRAGWPRAAQAIYTVYATQCHQLPQRSFFLFGTKPMYALGEIQAAFLVTDEPLVLRQFTGTPLMGWKVAWSDRMVYMYGGLFIVGLVYALVRRHVRPVSWKVAALLALPIALDGASHMLSDFSGMGAGFRDTNAWFALLTNHAFPPTFYAGDTLGSLNSWLRLVTAVLFSVGIGWFAFPWLDALAMERWPDAPSGRRRLW